MKKDRVRTTVTIPIELLEATDKAVKSGKAKTRFLNFRGKLDDLTIAQLDRALSIALDLPGQK
jgi:hypothetical protein